MFELAWQSVLLPLAVSLAIAYGMRATPVWSIAAVLGFLAAWFAIEGQLPLAGGLGIIDALPLAVLGYVVISVLPASSLARPVAMLWAAGLFVLIAGKFADQLTAAAWATTALSVVIPVVAARRPATGDPIAWERLLWMAPIFIVGLSMAADSSLRLFQLSFAAGFAVAGVVLVQLTSDRFPALAHAVVVWAVLWSALHWVQLDALVIALALAPLAVLWWPKGSSLKVFATGAGVGVISLLVSLWWVWPTASAGGY